MRFQSRYVLLSMVKVTVAEPRGMKVAVAEPRGVKVTVVEPRAGEDKDKTVLPELIV